MRLFILLLILALAGSCAAESASMTNDELRLAREESWNDYVRRRLQDETLIRETREQALSYGDVVMRYTITVKGKMPEGGYPLFIALHGGGQSDTPDINDQQWGQMGYYYSQWLNCGVYVAVRGVRDTWDTHFNPESYPLYDRLIEYMILTQNVNPDRVYLTGFSAGGDGVYAVSPRMADRFAAVNMSSGHPNGVSLVNLSNLPIQLQAGEYDTAYNRHTVTAEYGIYLDELQAAFGGGYEHRTLIHYNAGHNYADYSPKPLMVMTDSRAWLKDGDRSATRVDCFPPDYLASFVRNPYPTALAWDLSTRAELRATDSFYYLRAPKTTAGSIRIDLAGNNISIKTEELDGDFEILFNEEMIDFSKPLNFDVDGKYVSLKLDPDKTMLTETTAERGDPRYQFEASVKYSDLMSLPEAGAE